MHLGIFAFIDVGWFSLFVLAFYPLFLKPEEVNSIVNRLKAAAAAIKGAHVKYRGFAKKI